MNSFVRTAGIVFLRIYPDSYQDPSEDDSPRMSKNTMPAVFMVTSA